MKNIIRNNIKQIRKNITETDVKKLSYMASEVFLESDVYKNSKTIMCYMPLKGEADTSYMIEKAFLDGKNVAVPVTHPVTLDIVPYYITENTEYKKGSFSVTEPVGGIVAKKEDIDTVIVPGVAFDKNGARLGFGKGCYDRFLSDYKGIKVGFSLGFQIYDEIPSQEHDVKMDYIVSEKGIFSNKKTIES